MLRLPASRRADSRSASRSPSPPPQKQKKKLSGDDLKRTSNPEEEEDVEDNIGLGGRRIIVARPRSLSPESDASSPENLQVITANMKKGMKKSLSSRLGPVDPGVQQQQFSEKEIYEEMLRQQERRRIAIEEKEIRKLKKAMKKKEKLERKLKKHDKKESKKKSKKVLDDDSDFSEGDMLVSGNQTLKSLYLQFSLATWLLLINSVSFFTLLQMLSSHLLLRLRAHISESVVLRVWKKGPERDSHWRVEQLVELSKGQVQMIEKLVK